MSSFIRALLNMAILLALCVVMLGAYTRLTDAGLGCPDWPGCYGHMIPSKQGLPAEGLESTKAWTEMIHRYAAGLLGLFIVGITILSIFQKKNRCLSFFLLLLLVFQAALGMWTVTLKLLPLVVMGHLIGGMLIFACLCALRVKKSALAIHYSSLHHWILGGFFLLLGQIALGGWVSSNYAGLACIGFPQCNGQWVPSLHFTEALNLFSPIGHNYQGGVLNHAIRVTIQFCHRLGAVLIACYITGLAFWILLKTSSKSLHRLATSAFFLVVLQFILGVLNVVYLLPLIIAVLHNGVAALLLATLFIMANLTRGPLHAA